MKYDGFIVSHLCETPQSLCRLEDDFHLCSSPELLENLANWATIDSKRVLTAKIEIIYSIQKKYLLDLSHVVNDIHRHNVQVSNSQQMS